MRSAVVSVDIGGSSVRGALWSQDGCVARRARPTFGPEVDPLSSIRTVINELFSEAVSTGIGVVAIGAGVPGIVHDGVVGYSANLRWSDVALGSILENRYRVPVVIDHDARAATMAEFAVRSRGDRTLTDLLFIPIGTGIGGAIVSDGRLFRGGSGGAGEFGHQVVIPGGEECSCGQRGCVEVYSSAVNIARRYRAASGDTVATAEDVIARSATDEVAAAAWSDAIEALAAGIVATTALLDPQIVVIGGGLARAGDRLIAPLTSSVEARLPWRTAPRLEASVVGVDAGLIGAALLVAPDLPVERAGFVDPVATRKAG